MSNEQTCQCGQSHGACNTEFQYAVKIVCGSQPNTGAPINMPVAPGTYWTAINIHNPAKCEAARFRWKVVVANPIHGNPGPTPKYSLREIGLGPDMGIEIDTFDILNALTPLPGFVKGYVVIESNIELDVVAVYSGSQAAGGAPGLNSFHTERVQPRCVPVCEDLVLPLHTGMMAWQTASPTLGPVALVAGSPPAPFGASVVSQRPTDWTSANPATSLIYKLCFDLCFGFEVQTPLQIQGFANDSAQVFLNSTAIGNLPNALTTFTVPIPTLASSLQAGRNCLEVRVNNLVNSTTGFAIAGILRVIRGKCPCSLLPIAPPPAALP